MKTQTTRSQGSVAAGKLILASAPLILGSTIATAQDVSITAPTDLRVVVGSAFDTSSFSVTNSQITDSSVDWSLTNGTLSRLDQTSSLDNTDTQSNDATATPWIGSTLRGSNFGSLYYAPDLTGLTAGQSRAYQLTADSNGQSLATQNITMLQNRVLTGSTTINAGRHVVGNTAIGNLSLSGGSLTGVQGTNISVNSGGYAKFANGLVLSSSSDFTFNDAGQSHDLNVAYYGPLGAYSISNYALPDASVTGYTTTNGDLRQDLGGSWVTSAEYGNIFGDTQTFTANDKSSWSALPGDDRVINLPDNHGTISGYVYSQELAETLQPTIDETRSSTIDGIQTNWELARGAGEITNERQDSLISGDTSAIGSSLDLSGVELNVTGTAVTNRYLNNGTVDLGRQMIGSASQTIIRNDTVTLTTSGGDDTRTRITLEGINETSGGVSAIHTGASVFNDAGDTTQVQLSGNFTIDGNVQGTQFIGVNGASSITGEGLVGESTQNSLNLGYTYGVVENNNLKATNLLIIEDADLSGSRSYSAIVYREHSTATHTDIGIDYSTASLTLSGNLGSGLGGAGASTVLATAEGLVGEDISGASASFYGLRAGVTGASNSVSVSSGESFLTDGDILTLTDNGSGIYQKHTDVNSLAISGIDSLNFKVDKVGSGSQIAHGDSLGFTVSYIGDSTAPQAGELGRILRGSLDVTTSEVTDYSAISSAALGQGLSNSLIRGSISSNSQTTSTALEMRFDATAATTGMSTVAVGTDLGNNGLSLENSEDNTSAGFSLATNFELRDSEILTTAANIEATFNNLDDATSEVVNALGSTASLAGVHGTNVGFTSDILELTGLDGTLHVLELSYDETASANSEGGSQLLWLTTVDPLAATPELVWVNAILGNSDIDTLNLLTGEVMLVGETELMDISVLLEDRRHAGSYDDYLAAGGLEDPELGAWGVDEDTNVAWAVIDHNSSFSVATASVPEPSSSALFALGGLALTIRRKRRNA